MGLLSQLIETGKPETPKPEAAFPYAPCPTCGSPGFWQDIYRGPTGPWRCSVCDPWPTRAMVLRAGVITDVATVGPVVAQAGDSAPAEFDATLEIIDLPDGGWSAVPRGGRRSRFGPRGGETLDEWFDRLPGLP